MIIATWNVERLKHKTSLERIKAECELIGADILVLTETDQRLRRSCKIYCVNSEKVI